MEMIELNIEQGDLAGVWNFVQLLQKYTGVYLAKETDLQDKINELANPFRLRDEECFANLMDRVGHCLEALHRHNIYGYSTPPMGSAEGLMAEVPE